MSHNLYARDVVIFIFALIAMYNYKPLLPTLRILRVFLKRLAIFMKDDITWFCHPDLWWENYVLRQVGING